MSPTVGDLVAQVLTSLDHLVETAGPVDEEWQYVEDLRAVWRARILALTAPRSADPAPAAAAGAIDALTRVAAAIEDPHRAIDWLSTLPQVALLALGEATA